MPRLYVGIGGVALLLLFLSACTPNSPLPFQSPLANTQPTSTSILTPTVVSTLTTTSTITYIVIPDSAQHSSPWGAFWDSLALDRIANLFAIAAIIVGGLAAYYKFFKGRIFALRLVLNIDGKFIRKDELDFLLVKARISNIGLSKLSLGTIAATTKILPFTHSQYRRIFNQVNWSQSSLPLIMFKGEEFIEPGESLEDEILVVLIDKEIIAYMLQFTVASAGNQWSARKIVVQGENDQAEPQKLQVGE